MGAAQTVATFPGQNVPVPSTYTLHYRIVVTNAAASLASLLTGGVIPAIPAANDTTSKYTFGYVQISAETDPSGAGNPKVRFTQDGQTAPTATLGQVIPFENSGPVTIPSRPEEIKLISTGANVNCQVYLGIMGKDKPTIPGF